MRTGGKERVVATGTIEQGKGSGRFEREGGKPVPPARPPSSLKGRLKVVGPGLIIAATGVGAGDLCPRWPRAGVRLHLRVGGRGRGGPEVLPDRGDRPLVPGHRHHDHRGASTRSAASCAATSSFYLFLLAFVFGAAVASASGLALEAMLPFLPTWAWAVIASIVGLRHQRDRPLRRLRAGDAGARRAHVRHHGRVRHPVTPNLGDIAGGLVRGCRTARCSTASA